MTGRKSRQRTLRLASLLLACFGLSCATPSLEIIPKPTDLTVIRGDGPAAVEGSSVLQLPDRFVWGATVLEGDDGRYHMLFNTWAAGPQVPKFSDSWVLLSEIGYAVSDFPDKGFEFQKVVVRGRKYDGDSLAWDAQMVTNPHLQRFDGRYFLYYVGSRDPGEQPIGSTGENVRQRDRVQQSQQIGVITFDSFEHLLAGRFERPEAPLLSPRTRVKKDNIVDPSPEGTAAMPDNIVVVNPSVVRSPLDGNYLLYFKGNHYDPGWKGVHGVAVGASPEGPFEALDEYVFDIRMPDGKIASAEDPFVWHHQTHKRFYAVVKDFTGTITGSRPGLALLESSDGLTWTRPAHPTFMNKEIPVIGATSISVDRLERPQLLVDSDGTPQVLYAACSIDPANDKTDGGTFNVQIALEVK